MISERHTPVFDACPHTNRTWAASNSHSLASRRAFAAPSDRILANAASAHLAISAKGSATPSQGRPRDRLTNVDPMSSQPVVQRNTSPPTPVRSNAPRDPDHGIPTPASIAQDEPTPKRRLQAGRSKTAPIEQENHLWKSSVDRPQLSERDSIFATTYLASDSPASSPRVSARTLETTDDAPEHSLLDMAVPAPPPRRLIDPPVVRRKLSTFAPIPMNAHHAVLTTHFNPQTPAVSSTGRGDKQRSPPPYMSPVDSPVYRPTTPRHRDVQSALQEVLQESEERLRNREWREGKPVPFKGNDFQNNPALDTAIGKKIEATLAKTDQPTSARSRKASHYLRVFKDADTTEEQKKRDAKPKDRRPTDKLLPKLSEEGSARTDSTEAVTVTQPLQRPSRPSSAVQSPQAGPIESYFDKVPTPQSEIGPAITLANEARATLDERTLSKHPLPWRLLEEIRGFGNLTPGAKPGSSFSRSLPTSAVEKHRARAVTIDAGYQHGEPSDYFQVKGEYAVGRSPTSEEEDDSEREQISSALYFPHRQLKSNEQDSTVRRKQEAEIGDVQRNESILAGKEPRSWVTDEVVQSPQGVEISLQSQDTNQCLHGDLQAAASVHKEDSQPLTSSSVEAFSAESETESLAESTHSLLGYESSATDDLGTTPTATRLKQEPKSTSIAPSQPPAPLGAVELKPYDHQVGGHSTVYRFSRRAVCKQLNNRENEFYETIERQHPELLSFLPR